MSTLLSILVMGWKVNILSALFTILTASVLKPRALKEFSNEMCLIALIQILIPYHFFILFLTAAYEAYKGMK